MKLSAGLFFCTVLIFLTAPLAPEAQAEVKSLCTRCIGSGCSNAVGVTVLRKGANKRAVVRVWQRIGGKQRRLGSYSAATLKDPLRIKGRNIYMDVYCGYCLTDAPLYDCSISVKKITGQRARFTKTITEFSLWCEQGFDQLLDLAPPAEPWCIAPLE